MQRWIRTVGDRLVAVLACAIGGTALFMLMANAGQVARGALWGAACLLICVAGLLRAIGMLGGGAEAATGLWATRLGSLTGEPRWLAPLVAAPLALLIVVLGAGLFGGAALPWAIVGALLVLLPAALRRPGLLLFVVASLLYLPLLGSFGLWDCWETHYGEVAREILSRDDWISLWWAQDRWFWSKPVLIFWAEALLWSASGIGFRPEANLEHIEWVLRMPTYLCSMLGLLCAYAAISRAFGRRAGLLAGLVLATTPFYAMLSHQAMTDMACNGLMIAAVMLLLLAVHEDPERRVRSYAVGPLSLSAQSLVIGAFLAICIPQILYLASRNVAFRAGLFRPHLDRFVFGSPGNEDVPGNFELRVEHAYFDALHQQPLAWALVFALGCAAVVWWYRGERRAQPLYMLGFYICCGLAFMAKGILGFAVPGLIALLYLIGCQRWSLLTSGKLRIASGVLAMTTLSLPWFLAMTMRHGPAFLERLLVHDHIDRLTSGVHGGTGSVQYYIQQLGYGMFPWIALAPVALGCAPFFRPRAGLAPEVALRQRETAIALGLWFAATFALFSAMTTKFHHYIFSAVPPVALLCGLVLDRMLQDGRPDALQPRGGGRGWLAMALALCAPLPLVLGVAGLRGDVRGALPDAVPTGLQASWVFRHAWDLGASLGLCALGAGLLCAAAVGFRAPSRDPDGDRPLSAALLASAVVCALVGRDLSWTTAMRPAGSEHLAQLFIYKYERPFPADFDYRAILGGFAIVATVLLLLAAWRALRTAATLGLCGLSVLFAAFCLDVYMIDLTPHWSQRDLIRRYYRERSGPTEPLLAWQMYWRGETFYTGNRIAAFASVKNTEIKAWLAQTENQGKTVYVLLEHQRVDRLKTLLGARPVELLTRARDNNKFVLARVRL
jgi:4-amino-4-deoxy-L-arabinose transferase-like glycosyltransferase